MIESGDYLDTRFQNQLRSRSFPGANWLQTLVVNTAEAAGFTPARANIWLYRLPSLFGAIGAVLLTYWAALAFVSRRPSLIAAGMMATSLLLGVQARLAKADAILLLCIVAAMGALARVYLTARRKPGEAVPLHVVAIFWTALAAGVLIKGAAILLIVGFTIIDAWRPRPIVAVAWAIAFRRLVVVRGVAGSAARAPSEPRRRGGGCKRTHRAPARRLRGPWGSARLLPGAVLADVLAGCRARRSGCSHGMARRREPGAQFLLAWLVPAWLFFELIPVKAPFHVLPLYPAIAILIAGIVERGSLVTMRGMHFGLAGWMIVPLVFGILDDCRLHHAAGRAPPAGMAASAGAIVMDCSPGGCSI